MATRSSRLPIVPLLLFAATLAVYAPSLANGLTNWDDPHYVDENPFATEGLAGIPAAFTSGWQDAWYPLTHSVYCIIQAFAGPSPLAHHLVQIVLAALAVACLPAALATCGLRRPLGCAVALVWMAHPMRVESFSWVSSLKDVLSLLGVVLAFAAWGHGRKPLAAIAFAGAVLAKTTVFPLALLFVWLDTDGRTPRDLAASLRRTLPLWAPALACTAITAWLHTFSGHVGIRDFAGGSFLGAFPSALWLPWWYVGRALAVAQPQAVYSFSPVGWADARLLVALLIWVAALVAVWRIRASSLRIRGAALLAFALPFAPVTGLVPLAYPVADRYALVPSLVLAALLVIGVDALLRSIPRPHLARAAALGVLVAVVAVLLPPNVARQGAWKDSIGLWEADLHRAPDVGAVYINLAGGYGGAGRWAEAGATLREMHRRQLPYPHMARDLFFAQAAHDGMDPNLVLELSARIEEANGDARTIRAIAAVAKAAGHPAAAAAMAPFAGIAATVD